MLAATGCIWTLPSKHICDGRGGDDLGSATYGQIAADSKRADVEIGRHLNRSCMPLRMKKRKNILLPVKLSVSLTGLTVMLGSSMTTQIMLALAWLTILLIKNHAKQPAVWISVTGSAFSSILSNDLYDFFVKAGRTIFLKKSWTYGKRIKAGRTIFL